MPSDAVHPEVVLIRADRQRRRGEHPRHCHPPLDLFYVEAGLRQRGTDVQLIDLWLAEGAAQLVARYAQPPKIAVIRGESWCLHESRALAREFRRRGCLTVAVGQQAYHHRAGTGAGDWDLVVPGECELALPALLQELLDGAGAAVAECRRRWQQGGAYLVDDPDRLPELHVDPARLRCYPFPLPVRGRPVSCWGYVQSAWGCPYACDHCTDVVRKSTGSRLRRRSVVRVVDDIAAQLDAGAEGIIFEDDTLFCSPAHLKALCGEIERRGLRFPWVANARPDELDRSRVTAAAGAGAALLKLGIETAVPALARQIGKHRDEGCWRQLCEEGVRRLDRHGVGALGLMMVGLPGETDRQAQQSRRWLVAQPLDYVQTQIFTRYPDVALAESAVSAGTVFHYEAGVGSERRQYLRWQRQLYRRFYLRPGYLLRHLRLFWRWYVTPKRLRQSVEQLRFLGPFKASGDLRR